MLDLILQTLEGLDEKFHALYKKQEDGTFKLDVKGLPDPGPLLRAKEHEKAARVKAEETLEATQATLKELQAQLDELKTTGPRKKGDVEALEASWQTKLERQKTDYEAQVKALTGHLEKVYKQDVAHRLAAEISDSPDLLVPLIQARLQFQVGTGGPETRVLDSDGKLSALTIEELRDEFKGNTKYAAVIRGSSASGGAASNGSEKPASGSVSLQQFATMPEAERVKLHQQNPAVFRQLLAQHQESVRAQH